MTRLPVAVVGVGHLGKEHARILASLPGADLVAVVDPNAAQAEAVAQKCNTAALTDYRALPDHVRAAVVAAPTFSHHVIATELLSRGISLLMEKPLASNGIQAAELVDLAERHGAVLQVGHIERFNPAFEELQSRLLRPLYVSCERCGGFTGRSTDVGVVLDLMIHDLDLVLSLVKAPLVRVEAMGAALLGGHEDMAQARLTFANGCVADLTASRVHPEPLRRMRVWSAEGYGGVDFAKKRVTLMQPAEPLRQRRIDSRRLSPEMAGSLKAELFGRFVQTVELDCGDRYLGDQLTRELEEFLTCARTGARPRVDGQAGLAALEAADQVLSSLKAHAWGEGGPAGLQLPAAKGWLFGPTAAEAA